MISSNIAVFLIYDGNAQPQTYVQGLKYRQKNNLFEHAGKAISAKAIESSPLKIFFFRFFTRCII
jgi:hypothetical protein